MFIFGILFLQVTLVVVIVVLDPERTKKRRPPIQEPRVVFAPDTPDFSSVERQNFDVISNGSARSMRQRKIDNDLNGSRIEDQSILPGITQTSTQMGSPSSSGRFGMSKVEKVD